MEGGRVCFVYWEVWMRFLWWACGWWEGGWVYKSNAGDVCFYRIVS